MLHHAQAECRLRYGLVFGSSSKFKKVNRSLTDVLQTMSCKSYFEEYDIAMSWYQYDTEQKPSIYYSKCITLFIFFQQSARKFIIIVEMCIGMRAFKFAQKHFLLPLNVSFCTGVFNKFIEFSYTTVFLYLFFLIIPHILFVYRNEELKFTYKTSLKKRKLIYSSHSTQRQNHKRTLNIIVFIGVLIPLLLPRN